MAPKKLVFGKNGEQEDKQQTPADEESGSYSDSEEEEEEEEEGTVLPPGEPKSVIPGELAGPEPGEIGSACSSPSVSGFIIMPAVKPGGGKTTTTTKTPASNKKFSDEDVIALLKGLGAFWANGRNNKWTEFHQFVKDDLANQFSKVQVSEKIRALKKKFETNSERARANGGRLDFPDSHESVVFELSRALWGDEEGIDQETGERAENVIEEANKKPREMEQVDDEHDEVNKTTRKREEVDDEVDEGSKKSGKQKQVEEHDDGNKKRRKRKRVDEHDQRNKISEQEKLEDEHDEKSKISKQGKQEDEHDEKSKISKQGNQEDEHDEKSKILEQGKQEDEDYEENNIPPKGKTVMEMSKQDFKSAYPLLYASFDKFGHPRIAKKLCVLVAQEKAQELEQKWRELSAEASRLELKRIDLIKRDLQDHLQRK